jgi:hypothetical protein
LNGSSGIIFPGSHRGTVWLDEDSHPPWIDFWGQRQQEEVIERELVTMLMSIHVENSEPL